MGELLAVLALLLFSANVFAVRVASTRLAQDVGFLVALAANVLFGGALSGLDLLLRTDGFRFDPWGILMFAFGGICASYLGRRGFFASVQTLGPSRASAIQITNPIFAAVFAWALLDEHLGVPEIILVAVTLTGLLLSSLRRGDTSIRLQPPRSGRPGTLHALYAALPVRLLLPAVLSAAAYGAGNVLRAGALDTWREPVLGGFVGALAGMVAYTTFHVVPRRVTRRLRDVTVPGVALWGLAGVLTISAQVSVIAATAYIPVAVVLVISSALPIVVIPVSLLVLGKAEDIGSTTVLGALLVLVGVSGILLLR
jgi:drug/metabolite transporter (DMT)-like permease